MSSLVIQLILAEKFKYATRLDMAQLADALGMEKATVMNKVSAKTLGVRTYLDGGKRWADIRDVADHMDRMRERAEA
jgi:hypothetical protein